MGKKVEMIGRTFGRWTVLAESKERTKSGTIRYKCICQCGTVREVSGCLLRNGDSTSCGCYNHEIITKQDAVYKERLYSVWMSMKDRCRNPNNKAYRNYGARGIEVCEEWRRDYKAFREWAMKNGYNQGLWIDRIDNDYGYSPENCRWVTPATQSRNKRTTRLVRHNGEYVCLKDAEMLSGIKAATISRRIELGWDDSKLFQPVEMKYSHGEAISAALKSR